MYKKKEKNQCNEKKPTSATAAACLNVCIMRKKRGGGGEVTATHLDQTRHTEGTSNEDRRVRKLPRLGIDPAPVKASNRLT